MLIGFDHRQLQDPRERGLGGAVAGRPDRPAGDVAGPADEWHCRTADATAELALMAGLQPGMRVLDVGCGAGGAARRLAAGYGVSVVGIDSSRAHVQLARHLTRRAGGPARVRFQCSRAESAPFATASFECVWLQHVLLHIHEKARLFAELRRMLVPGGVVALHELVAPRGGGLRFPLPWAASAAETFVPAPERLRIALESAGFVLALWRDTTPAARHWCGRLLEWAEGPHGGGPVIAPGAVAALHHLTDGLADGTLGVAMAVFHKPD